MQRSASTAWVFALCACVLSLGLGNDTAEAQQPKDYQEEKLVGYLVTLEQRKFDASLLKNLKVPDGFRVSVFARDLENPRKMAVSEDGTVYVTRRQNSDVLALPDRNGDGRADEVRTVVSDLEHVNGITISEGRLYLAPPTQVLVVEMKRGGSYGEPQVLIDHLPDGGQHPNRTLAFGPDGQLYISVGSSCNACDESNPEHATMLRATPDGSERMIFARGLRNTIGFDWHPRTGELWGMDHGTDWRGNDIPPEELNRIQEGRHYGWPFCYGDREVDPYIPANPEGTTKEDFCPQTVPPALTYQAHSAPMAMVFYNAEQFPEEYRGDAFVAMRGSWNRKPAVGYKVVRIRFENGQPQKIEDFLTGFLLEDGKSQFGRPVGLAIARDGSLLVADDSNGVIYRIAYVAEEARR